MTDKNVKSSICGCIVRLQEDGSWRLTEYCRVHKPNYQKKSEKMMHRMEKNRKRRTFLEQRQKNKKK